MAGPDLAKQYQNVIYLAGSASAEFFADIALCPFEAVKVRPRGRGRERPARSMHGSVGLEMLCEVPHQG